MGGHGRRGHGRELAALLWALVLGGCSSHSSSGGNDTSTDAGPEDASDDAAPVPPTCTATFDEGECSIGPTYTQAPELTVAAGVPRGMVTHFTMDAANSKIYPGTFTRDVWVYIPMQYVDGTEIALMVVQDGNQFMTQITAALDTLIAAKSLPQMVGIFVGTTQDSERSVEYDTVSDAYTRFVESEVLPLVPANPDIQATYKNLDVTTNPDGRASFGGSSGGAAAFTMGWFHPELYHRIVTYSGSFVDLQPTAAYPHGAWVDPEHLVAGSPAEPLRVTLEVGSGDLNLDTISGDDMHGWVDANEGMATALKAQGYHYRFVYGIGAGHEDPGVIGQTLPDTLRWVWKGYQIP
ncbi:MAG: alpha/beta hydrolase [Polyangiaceae bacterium]